MQMDALIRRPAATWLVVLALAPIVAALWLVGCSELSDKVVERVGAEEVSRRLQEDTNGTLLLIDVRRPSEFRAGTIPGAVNLRLGDVAIDGREPALARYESFIVFGQNPGDATAMAMAKRLLTAKYSGVALFEAGVDGWVAAGMRLQPGGASPATPK